MTPNKALLSLVLAIPLIACGGGSSDSKPDTAIPVDVAKPLDTSGFDGPAQLRDTSPPRDGLVDLSGAMDSPKDLSPVDQSMDRSADGARDVSLDTPVVDAAVDRPALGDGGDAREVGGVSEDTGIQANQVFPCTKDTDCCTIVDSCMGMAYLYSKGVGASPMPSIPPRSGTCLPCIPPSIQLKCQAGTCVGEKVNAYDSKLSAGHCGYIPAADAGVHAPVDASVLPARTSWSCGS